MSDPATLILVVEDDPEMQRYIRRVLEINGYATLGAANGLEALPLLAQQAPALVLLDLMMPFMDGLSTCRAIRRTSHCPIIVLSALADESRIVSALEEGADDYLSKPFGTAELIARVRAVLRRHRARLRESNLPSGPVHVGPLTIDPESGAVRRAGEAIHLTPTEQKVLRVLAHRVGQVVPHRTILQEVWGPEYRDEHEYTHVYVGKLRQKLEEDPTAPRHLLTIPGIGYRLADE